MYIMTSALVLNSKIVFEFKDKHVVKLGIKQDDRFLFALQLKKGDEKVLDLFCSLKPLSEIYLDQLKKLSKNSV